DAVSVGYMAARTLRTLLFAVRTALYAVTFETLFSFARRIASGSVIGRSVESVDVCCACGVCCAPRMAGAASKTINFRCMFSWAPSLVQLHAAPGCPCGGFPFVPVGP